MDKVSIIVPVYNVAPYLARCIDSLLGQTYYNLEVLLVDDASPDSSKEIILDYSQKDQRIHPIFQEYNQGVSAARNRALDEMTGDWVCFCDGDDWYENDFLEKMLMCAKNESADYIICNYQIVADHKVAIISGSISGLKSGSDTRKIIACGPTSSCTHMIHRSLFDKSGVRYPRGCRQNEELPVIPVLAKYARRVGIVNEPLYNYYQRGDGSSASNTSVESEENFLFAWNKMREALGEGYEEELQYHAIYALLYGKILELCKNNVKTKEIKKKIKEYEKEFVGYRNNKYIENMGRAKQIFLWMVHKRFVFGLRLLSWLHSKIVN